jgi:autotransporter-associated beta strand protein
MVKRLALSFIDVNLTVSVEFSVRIRVWKGVSSTATAPTLTANTSGGLTFQGSGTTILSGVNSYTGNTTISAGTLALSGSGSIANSANIIVNGALDVSGVTTTPYHFVSGQTLKGSGGTINGGLTFDSGASLGLTYSGSPLLISANGTLAMNNNAANITYSGSALTPGNYKLISAETGGSVSGNVSSSVVTYTATGAIGAHTSSLTYDSGGLYLTVNNRAPSADSISMGALGGVASTLQIIGGKYAPTDLDGDAVNTIASVSTPGHGTATISGNNIIYTPESSYTGQDSFTYTVSDIYGGTSAAATVSVNVQSGSGIGQQAQITLGGGSAALKFWGVPGQTYTIQRSTTSVNGPWDDLGIAVANDVGAQPIGQINYTDTPAPTGSAYYRLKP